MVFIKRITLILVAAMLLSPSSLAQKKEKQPINERLFFGGMFALQIGSYTAIEVSPLAGYRVTPRLSLATGIKYEFLSNKQVGFEYRTHIYGLRTFARYHIIPNLADLLGGGINLGLFAQLEYEGLSLERQYFDYPAYPPEGRFWLSSILIGGGISIPTGMRGAINFSILYNLNETANSIYYNNPIIRFGFTF